MAARSSHSHSHSSRRAPYSRSSHSPSTEKYPFKFLITEDDILSKTVDNKSIMEDKDNKHIQYNGNIITIFNTNIFNINEKSDRIYISFDIIADSNPLNKKQNCALSLLNEIFTQNYINTIFVNDDGNTIINPSNSEIMFEDKINNNLINFNQFINLFKGQRNIFIDGMNILSANYGAITSTAEIGRKTYTFQECIDVIKDIKILKKINNIGKRRNYHLIDEEWYRENNGLNNCNFIMILHNYVMKKHYESELKRLINANLEADRDKIKDILIILSKLEKSHITSINSQIELNSGDGYLTNITFIILKESPPIIKKKVNPRSETDIQCSQGTEADDLLLIYLLKQCNGFYLSFDNYGWLSTRDIRLTSNNLLNNTKPFHGLPELTHESLTYYNNLFNEMEFNTNKEILSKDKFKEDIYKIYIEKGYINYNNELKEKINNFKDNLNTLHPTYNFETELQIIKNNLKEIKYFMNLPGGDIDINNFKNTKTTRLYEYLTLLKQFFPTDLPIIKFLDAFMNITINNVIDFTNLDIDTIGIPPAAAAAVNEAEPPAKFRGDLRALLTASTPAAPAASVFSRLSAPAAPAASVFSRLGLPLGPLSGGSKKIKMTQKKNKKNKKKKLTRKMRK